jgi:hypothetical protein
VAGRAGPLLHVCGQVIECCQVGGEYLFLTQTGTVLGFAEDPQDADEVVNEVVNDLIDDLAPKDAARKSAAAVAAPRPARREPVSETGDSSAA